MERRKVMGIGAGPAVLPVWWGLRQAVNGADEDWRTETEPLERAFPVPGPLHAATWVSSRGDERCLASPELVISGFARLAPGKLAGLTAA
ncbi:hypothetical protein [Streptomyces sp. NPDC060194]|uniref:hypothetical protein n=1 Tax=Streptomyces sp. NPDC060194 TaxID=3347069 RepID=UPI0036684A94